MANLTKEALGRLISPAKRHYASKINQRTVAKRLNSVVDNTVDVASDVSSIRSGKANQIEGTFVLSNGRVYGQHNGILFPISGPGIYQLDRGSFKALGVLNQFGNTSKAGDILNKMGINEKTLNQALAVYNSTN